MPTSVPADRNSLETRRFSPTERNGSDVEGKLRSSVRVRPRVRAGQVLVLAIFATRLLTGQGDRVGIINGRVHSVDPTTADLSNFVIWVDDINSRFAAPGEPAVMNQKDLRFIPHVLAVQAGTTVTFPNADPMSHNVFSISEAKRFNLGLYGRSMIRRVTFDRPGVVDLLCNVHLEMSAYIVVVNNPYFAQTSANGTCQIARVPAGRHRLRCWHEGAPIQEQDVEVPENGSVAVDFFAQK